MLRDSNIPLFLWIAAAVLVHLTWKDGAERASAVIEERMDLQRFALAVRSHARGTQPTLEVSFEESKPPDAEPQPSEVGETNEAAEDDPTDAPPPAPEKPKPKLDRPEPEPKPELAKKPEKKPEPEREKPAVPVKPPEPLPEVAVRNRIAVRQHVEKPLEDDNENAEFIANEANRVQEQTQARITSTTQNDPNPTPGGSYASPHSEPGNAHETRVAQDEDSPGVAGHAPNERTGETEGEVLPAQAAAAARGEGSQAVAPGAREQAVAKAQPSRLPAQAEQVGRAASQSVTGAPDLTQSSQGQDSVAAAQAAQRAQQAEPRRRKRLPPPKAQGGLSDLLGFGAHGTTANGLNLNLTPSTAVAAIGRDTLARERRADAERRRSQHLGSWRSSGIERWRSAIENYVPSVKPGNQTALNTARVPFSDYLNVIHNRLHPIFADDFLASLSALPGSHPMNQDGLRTNLEIVLSPEDGRIVRMGVTRTSGVTAFDIAALESVKRASPFGPPPKVIVSPDGNVYFHWEFYRNPMYACSTYFARPYILKAQPKTAPPDVTPPPAEPMDEAGPRRERHGSWRDHAPATLEALGFLR